MAFDLYVGSFTRYIVGDWENQGQRVARELGQDYKIIRDNETEEAEDPDEVRGEVLGWRTKLNEGLKEHLEGGLDWLEEEDAPYLTDRPDWHGWAALMLKASYADSEMEAPETVPEEWGDDPAYEEATSDDSDTSYPTLLMADLWLPGDFDFMFGVEDLGGNPRSVASLGALKLELQLLNDSVFQLDAEGLAEAAAQNPGPEAPLDALAASTLGMLTRLCDEAIRQKLPMMPDY